MDIANANGRLRAAGVRVRIRAKGKKLYLRATLPPKSGEGPWKQQEISLGVSDNREGVRAAFAEAKRVGGLLDSRNFSWGNFREEIREEVADLIEQFEEKYFEAKERNHATERTFKKDFADVLKHLPEPTMAAMRDLVLSKPANSRTRKRYALACGRFADYLGLNGAEFRGLTGGYGLKALSPRAIPTDEQIWEAWWGLPQELQWGFGIMACYGLRPCELYLLDWSERPMLRVKDGKTKTRVTFPLPPAWEPSIPDGGPPKTIQKGNANRGAFVGKVYRKHLNFHLYDLRHAWAIRAIDHGLDLTLAAQQMGHGVKVHTEIYCHWIGADIHRKAWEKAKAMTSALPLIR